MRFAGLIVVALFYIAGLHASEEFEHEEGVLVLTKENFDKVLEKYDYVLIEFYAPWCGHCKQLAPEYAKAAKTLADKDSPVKLAKVDATKEGKLAEDHGVRGYPTLKFYRKPNFIEYTGGRQADDIVDWIEKKTGPAAKTLTTVAETAELVESKDVAIVGCFKDPESAAAKVYLEVASAIDDHVFGISSSQEVFDEYKAKDGQVLLFKKFDEGKSVYEEELEPEQLKKFISVQSLPLLVDFNHETAQKIFGGDIKSHLLVFLSKKAGHFEKYSDAIKEPAKDYRGKILFVTINADEDDHERILEFFGMKKDQVPSMRIIKLEEDMAKYKPAKPELTSENIKNFVDAVQGGTIERDFLTQDLPEDWNKNPVKVLVGKNFAEVAFNKEKDVLVEFYAPWCGHCRQLEPIYDALGEKFKDHETIVIAKMDATANELKEVKVESFPTIKLYKKDDNEAVDYLGERTLEGLTQFLESGGVYGQGAAEVQEEDEDDDVPRKDEL
ncbi:protein disulfide-isomerase [Venturia canescens]|uniref:protein disulfide-isomerase n=1 Tax=Venturia canescens TaxID=32260 RepID=UPI001C9D2EDA|nr:protein disulfide-isomerase [Venturia canescens]